jgi:peptidoglycan/LPS O-acetylase OafA/YrhL
VQKTIHFAGLNGIRAIAAVAVVFAHFIPELDHYGLDPFFFGRSSTSRPLSTLLAGFGVSMFFALSGFLITYLLLAEKSISPIKIKHFYVRRILRIWPLYYLYLAISLLVIYLCSFDFHWSSLFFTIFMMANVPFVYGGAVPFMEGYWSLGVEEQFYLLWPWIASKARSLLKVTLSLIVLLLLIKIGCRVLDARTGLHWPYTVAQTFRFQCLLIGAVGAMLYYERHALFLRLAGHPLTQLAAWIIILLVAINRFHLASIIDNELICVVTVAIIVGQIEKTNRLVNLDISPFDFVGKVSYGIYVWHPLVIFVLPFILPKPTEPGWHHYVLVFVAVFGGVILLSYLSYRFFERPFLLWKSSFSTVQSFGSRGEALAAER